MKAAVLLLLCVVGAVYADMYLQNPRGSNDRLNEQTEDRQNGNRLFNTENNARGGYAWGPAMTYYEGSLLPLQWTAQHGCGSTEVECNIILQYMCTDPKNDPASIALRDGTTTNTIPDDVNQYNAKNGNGDYVYGMHESYQYYQDCKNRERNQGLFLADQNLQGNDARYTRQDAAGTKYGFECNEERDYYPYWGPSPWKDIAVLTPDMALCDLFTKQSQNVQAKQYCTGATGTTNNKQPITESTCVSAGGKWTTSPAFGIAAPDCQLAQYSRDNHLGNTLDAETAGYNWTIPSNEACAANGQCDCALRIRYNISTANTNNWGFDDSTKNGKNSPITGNPVQQYEGDDLQMAVNTNQYGRTFEDRSFMFHIAPRPAGIAADANIYNLNVRGKRGNIVQTFPATEYDFVPNNLQATEGDYVHFQWTGSDNNPQNNAGEGIAGTDRSNIVQTSGLNSNLPMTQDELDSANQMFDTADTRHNMAFVGQTNCPTIADLLKKNGNNQNAVNVDKTNCAKLNAAGPYFDGGVVRLNKTGTFYYMSSRNTNFSNRTQKGMITVNGKPVSNTAVIAVIVVFSVVGALGAAVGGTYFYARKFPHSKVAAFYDSIPRPSFMNRSSSHSASMSYSVNGDNKKPLLA